MTYNLSNMADRINLLMAQPTLNHRRDVLWLLEKRYPKEIDEIKQVFKQAWERKELTNDN